MRYADATEISGERSPMWAGSMIGPKVIPGNYKVRLVVGKNIIKEEIAEIFLQTGMYCGVPVAVDSFRLAREVFADMKI